MKTNWQQVAMVLLGLIFGGFAAGAVGHVQYNQLRAETSMRFDKMQTEFNERGLNIQAVLVEIGRLQEQVKGLREDVRYIKEKR